MSPDKHVEAVREMLLQRSIVGLKKYGVTTERTDIDLKGWIKHALEEAMDFCVYLQRIDSELTEKTYGAQTNKPLKD